VTQALGCQFRPISCVASLRVTRKEPLVLVGHASIDELGRHVLRRELEVAGDERRRSQARVPLFVRAGKAAGLPMAEVARSSGLSRKGAYDTLDRNVETRHDRTWGLDIALTALLAAAGPLSAQSADEVLRVGSSEVWEQLERLANEGIVHRLVGEHGNTTTHYAVNHDAAVQALARRLEDLRGVRAKGYSVYFAVAPDEIASIRTAAGEIIRDDEWELIPFGNNSFARTDELALVVRAPDRRAALETAEELWQLIAARANVRAKAMITQIIDPVRLRSAA